MLFTADLRVFKDYDGTREASGKVELATTPLKAFSTPSMDFPLTPPATVKSETIALELCIEEDVRTSKDNRHIARRSKRRKISSNAEDSFDD